MIDAEKLKVSVAAFMAVAAALFVNIYAAIPFALYEIWRAHQILEDSTETNGENE